LAESSSCEAESSSCEIDRLKSSLSCEAVLATQPILLIETADFDLRSLME